MRHRFYILIILTTLIVTSGAALFWWYYQNQTAPPPTPAQSAEPLAVDRPQASNLKLIIKTTAGDNNGFYTCQQQSCQNISQPDGLSPDALTNGQSWYYSGEQEGEQSDGQPDLLKTETNGQTQTIISSTRLTAPRDPIMSPDGQYLAYLLDNIHDPSAHLTEAWVYDTTSDSTRLLAEKLYAPDIRSRVHWNSNSNYLWFIADTGERNDPKDRLALLLASAQTPGASITFPEIDWNKLGEQADSLQLDISMSGDAASYVTRNFFGIQQLNVASGGSIQTTNARGTIVFTQWLENNELLYAVQDNTGFTFWNNSGGVHRFINRQPGRLLSAHGDVRGDYIAFASVNANISSSSTSLFSLHIATGTLLDEGRLTGADQAYILQVVSLPPPDDQNHPDISTELDDAQVIAFLDKNAGIITGDKNAHATRIIVTEQANTAYLDYQADEQDPQRVLVTVKDALHDEWSILGRYKSVNSEWQKTQGGGLPDPKATRLYEWENSLGQWILKTSN